MINICISHSVQVRQNIIGCLNDIFMPLSEMRVNLLKVNSGFFHEACAGFCGVFVC